MRKPFIGIRRAILTILAFSPLASAGVAASEMALPIVSVACVRESPSHAGELGSQVLMGIPVEVISHKGDWSEILTIDGYHGYIIDNSLLPLSHEDYDRWRASNRLVYTGNYQTTIYSTPGFCEPLSDIVPGCIVESIEPFGDRIKVRLPDGRIGYVSSIDGFTPLHEWANQDFNGERIISYAKRNLGVPYLWGGTSSKAMDCSGLTWVAAWLNGRLLPRNASSQAKIGVPIDSVDSLNEASLLFFGNKSTGRVNHVGIYEGNGDFLESSGRVKRSHLQLNNKRSGQGFLHAVDISSFPPIIATDRYNWLFH